jgi:hypothetical protein
MSFFFFKVYKKRKEVKIMFLFNLLSSVDPQTQQLLNNLMDVLLPILYTIAGFALAFSITKYS